ncbi:MAG: glycosyltransferase family 4 protein [Candidatus Aminicenantes bacterium]|nr:MAG: glycosyltransferase family 4 protein [Candidatus Aminicenantes bacterium]
MASSKRLLFLNRSFYPDVEATGQFLTELCQELEKDFEIHVICGNPLYRKVKKKGFVHKSYYGNITIWRINNTTFPKKFFFTKFINLFSYFVPCFFWIFFLKKMDCVIVETDPPLLASIAYVYSAIRRCPFIYYSQDIWPQVGIVTGAFSSTFIIKILKAINRFLYHRATRIIVPGQDMKKRLEEDSIPPHKVEIVENWADPGQIFPVKKENNIFLKKYSPGNKFVVMYSGNLGLSQDLENVIHLADSLKQTHEIEFVLVGEGALKDKLVNLSDSFGLKNIEFLTYQEKSDLKYSLSSAHIHLITLKKGMKGYIVPSKVYGIMAAGKPFIAAVDDGSEIQKIAEKYHCGIVVKPSNVEELKKAVLWAFHHRDQIEKMGENGRKALEDYYSKKICTQKFKKIVENIIC